MQLRQVATACCGVVVTAMCIVAGTAARHTGESEGSQEVSRHEGKTGKKKNNNKKKRSKKKNKGEKHPHLLWMENQHELKAPCTRLTQPRRLESITHSIHLRAALT